MNRSERVVRRFRLIQQMGGEIGHIVTYDRQYDCFDVTALPYRD